jgi:hypothetical protein
MVRRLLGVTAVAALFVLAFAGPAAADPYPPPDQGGSSTVPQGGTVSVSSDGWAPGSLVTVTLDSTPVVLGTLTADSSGHIEGTFTVPSNAALGTHSVVLSGTDPTGAPRTVSQTLIVVAATTSGPTLAFTGSNNSGMIAGIGSVAVVAGVALVVAARKRRASAPTA